ncbi:unnamed protein product [Peniophora sp. CBMAI 1063]|nr:unnamed protein product [Peniophora sp. CBMAI 1063]
MSSLSTSDSIISAFDALLPPHYTHVSTSASEDTLPGEVVPLAENERPSLLLDALGNESLIFEDEEREFLESPIVSTFPTSIASSLPDDHGFAYQCPSDASFCSIDEDPSAFLAAPPPPHPHEVDFTPDARGVIVRGHALFLDFPGVMLHAPKEGDVDQPIRPFVDEDNCFIRELPDPELLAPPATTFSGEVLGGDDYIVVPEGYTIGPGDEGTGALVERGISDEGAAGSEARNQDAREPCPPSRSISDKENTCAASQSSLRVLYDPEPGLSETLSTLIRSTSASSEWSLIAGQNAQDTYPSPAPEPQGIVLVPSKTIHAQSTCSLSASDSADTDIGWTGHVPSLILHIASDREDRDAQGYHCLPPITSYDYELLYAPPLSNNGRMEDVWEAYHYPFQALMQEAERQRQENESMCVQDMWHEITETVAKAWRAGGMGAFEPVTVIDAGEEETWKVGRRRESSGKEVAVWQEKGLTSWFARKFETGKRRLKSF